MLRRRAGDLRALLLAGLCAALLLAVGIPASAQRLTMRHVAVDALVFPLTPTQWALEAAVEDAGPEWERVDWMKITIDGNEHLATVNGWIGSIPWNAAGVGNPSEHVASARAQISGTMMGEPITMQLSSLNPPGGTPPGDGEPIRFILADLRIESLKFIAPISLRWDAATLVEKPEYLWDAAGQPPLIPWGSVPSTRAEPAAYVRNNPVEVEVTLFDNITGGCEIGCTLRLEATPNTGAAPLLLINHPAYPPTPKTVSGRVATFTGTTALYDAVAHYVVDVRDLQVWVKFSTGFWGLVSSADDAWGSLFATLDTPAAPMVQPWAPVLAYACDWAKGQSIIDVTTSHLTKGAYDHCAYDGTQEWHTQQATDENGYPLPVDRFFLLDFLTGPDSFKGQCTDLADFLVCLSNALGAAPVRPEVRAGPFNTNPITPAHEQNPAAYVTTRWQFHQYPRLTIGCTNIWDAALRFTFDAGGGVWTFNYPYNMQPDSYQTWLHNPSGPQPSVWGSATWWDVVPENSRP